MKIREVATMFYMAILILTIFVRDFEQVKDELEQCQSEQVLEF